MGPGFLELYSGFQSPGFRILQAWISRISDSTSKNFRYSGFPYIRRYKDRFSQPRSQGSLLPGLRKSGNEVACFIVIEITLSTNKNLSLIILTVLFWRGKQINVHEAKHTELVETWYSLCSILSKISKSQGYQFFFYLMLYTQIQALTLFLIELATALWTVVSKTC